jgi:hypothetical protein
VDVVQPVLDPFDGRRAEHLLAAPSERSDLVGELVDAALGLDRGTGERLTSAAFAVGL